MQTIGTIVFLAIGLVQLAATWAGMTDWLGLHWLIAGILTVFVGWTPLLGSILGVMGAVKVWQWEWWQAVLLFFGIPLGALAVAAVGGAFETWWPRRST